MDKEDHDILIAIQGTVQYMERRLFGDGQRGELSIMRLRIRTLEKHRWIFYGGIAVLLLLVGVELSDILKLVSGQR